MCDINFVVYPVLKLEYLYIIIETLCIVNSINKKGAGEITAVWNGVISPPTSHRTLLYLSYCNPHFDTQIPCDYLVV